MSNGQMEPIYRKRSYYGAGITGGGFGAMTGFTSVLMMDVPILPGLPILLAGIAVSAGLGELGMKRFLNKSFKGKILKELDIDDAQNQKELDRALKSSAYVQVSGNSLKALSSIKDTSSDDGVYSLADGVFEKVEVPTRQEKWDDSFSALTMLYEIEKTDEVFSSTPDIVAENSKAEKDIDQYKRELEELQELFQNFVESTKQAA